MTRSRRFGRGALGTGTSARDLHRQVITKPAERVKDERRGKTLCSKCHQEVVHVHVEGFGWQARNPDGIPHTLTCQGDT